MARNAILGLTLLVVVLLLAGYASTTWNGYHGALDDAGISTANLATVLDEHAQRTLRLVEVTVESLADTLNSAIETGPLNPDQITPILMNRKRITKDLFNIFLIDADGRSLTDAFGSRTPIDLNERSYVKFHRESGRSGIHVSEPAVSVAGRGRIVVVSHRLFNIDGSFAGVIGASVSAEYFQDFYRSVDVGPRGVVALGTREGAIVARTPVSEALLRGEAQPNPTLAEAVAAGRTSGTLDYVNRFDGVRRLTSFRTVAGSPYIVSVGRAHGDFLAPWWRDLWRYGIATLVLVAAAVGSCWSLLRQMAARGMADGARRAGERAAVAAVRKLAAQEHEVRERLETILNRMPLGCILCDASLKLTYMNATAERIFGCRIEDVKGLSPLETGFVVADPVAAEARHESLRRGTISGYTVAQTVTLKDRTITCEWTNTALKGSDGSFGGILAMVQDVTERSRAEEEIVRAQALEQATGRRLEMILNRMPLGCIVTDSELRYTYWNPSAEQILGHRFADVNGLRAVDIGTNLDDPAVVAARQARYRIGDADELITTSNLTKDGRRIKCEWYTTPMIGTDGAFQGVIALFQDATERSHAEEALRQAQKMEALGQLTGGVAHDFNNLLTVIMANIELVEPSCGDRPDEAESLQAALSAAIRAGELTRQLLAFSRRQTLEPRIVQINDLVREMMRLLSRTIGESVETVVETSPDAWLVRVDPTQLESALANLVVNARDAMSGGGRVVIETANAPLDEAYAAQHAEVTAGDYVVLSVSDTGSGMSPEVAARVFEPFFTTKEVGKGTGLGLSMVFGFVKQSGGHIKVYSELGIGTAIRLYLPRAIDGDAAAEPATVETPAPARAGETILLVEDDDAVRETVMRHFLRFGYQVLDARNGSVALAILDRGDRVDLLFTDMVMPGGMNGAELAIRARERRPGLKVLFTSGYTAPALASQMLQVDSAAILSKPYRIADLAREVRTLLDRA